MWSSTAVLVGGQYVVSGHGIMSLNLTHPSILEDQRLEYRIYLTSDLLPYMEELTVPGPIREETHVQVGLGVRAGGKCRQSEHIARQNRL